MKRILSIALVMNILAMLSGCSLGENPDFKFKLNEDRESYAIVEYRGDEEDVEIPRTHKDKPVTVIDGFNDNTNLESVKIPRGVERIERNAFNGCVNLEEVEFPKTLTYIGDYAFLECESLEEVDIPKGAYLGMGAFSTCTDLKVAYLGMEGNGDEEYEIDLWAFNGCESLTAVYIGNAYTILGRDIFPDCDSLMSLYISGSMEEIHIESLSGCNNLEEIYFDGTWEEWEKLEKSDFWIDKQVTVITN